MTDVPRATRIDRIIAAFSPRVGVQRLAARLQFEAMSGGYAGASRSRDGLSGWKTTQGDADADLIVDLPLLRERSRDLSRNNTIGSAAKSTKITHVVGTGLKLNASVDREFLGLSDDEADAWEGDVERRWALWWSDVHSDIESGLTGPEHQSLAFSSVLDNGDHFILLTRANRAGQVNPLALQHIEADRVCNENWKTDTDRLIGGVEKDVSGAPVFYHVLKSHPGRRYAKSAEWTKLRAFGETTGRPITLHMLDRLRAGQTRGVPHLAPVIEMIKQLGRYTDAEIDAAVKTAMFALVVQTETGEGLAGLNYGDWASTRKDFYKDNPINAKGGSSLAVGLFPDDTFTAFDPNRPNAAAEPFLAAMFQQIGMALEIPYEVLINHFSSSWSASQAALMQMWRTVTTRRAWLARRMLQPIYSTWLSEEIAAGHIAAPGFFVDPMVRAAYCGAEWIGDAKGHINEQQQVGAAKDRVDAGFSTMKRETAALTGEDWDRVRKQREKERRLFTPDAMKPTEPNDPIDAEREDDVGQPPARRERVHA